MKAYFGHDKVNIDPVIKLNEGKLRQKLIELSEKIIKAPVNASISIEDGKIVKKAETTGYALKYRKCCRTIRKHISENPGSSFDIQQLRIIMKYKQ